MNIEYYLQYAFRPSSWHIQKPGYYFSCVRKFFKRPELTIPELVSHFTKRFKLGVFYSMEKYKGKRLFVKELFV